ncbi:thiosulfohydrolase SoxB [Thiohalobacter thiocyanaticus]|uniref:Thiosulfohydrolase SoxB n=1 Tax=Thiohalobacter thiocyanaticus TaxID=585455 RepID=A0A426QHC2_9GAMM|nr:thiosulfohydrolase SoxB [Thiohalobacter thiocyanaticus]RRQ21158.1 thiosulfohydrolase SoxB [Thiohalobacter thiocyanaticus]
MSLSRREFLQMLAIAGMSGIHLSGCESGSSTQKQPGGVKPNAASSNLYDIPVFGNVSVMHYTDCHAQLLPVYFREPSINLGIADMRGRPPHLVGEHFLEYYGIKPGSREAHAFTYLNFEEAARTFGKVGGFAHLSTLVKQMRAQRPGSLLLDGGDTWQGSATSLWTNAQDMVDAQLLLGVDVMTAHWEMTYGAERVLEILENDLKDKVDFVAQNVVDRDWGDPIFKPYVIREINGVPTAIIGQAFPYTPIANPGYMIPDWSFGIRDERMQQMVDQARGEGAQVVIVLSHNGMDVDIKMASQVSGIDAIMGGHTHDAIPQPVVISNSGGKTLVTNAGSNSKFLGVLDLDVKNGKVRDYRYHLLPVFSNLLEADADMSAHIESVRAPYKEKLEEELAVTDSLLYRRGNFNGTFDQLICDAMIEEMGAEIAFSPGFRWGTSLLPGQPITFEDLMTQTALTYPSTTLNNMTGERIKVILEDIADNIYNKDPYYQQGGDMVRVGGLRYAIDPTAGIGNRISDMELNGKPIDPDKEYVVAGWANVNEPLDTRPIWDVVASYLRNQKTVNVTELNTPKLKNVAGNPGLAKSFQQ